MFEPLRELIDEAGSLHEWQTGVTIHRTQASLWSEFEDLADESESAVSWRETVAGLNNPGGIEPVAPPAGLALELRPYQLEGFRWLAFLHRHGLGGILADDMGLGKTAQTLALFAHAIEQSDVPSPPFLVVAPTSVVSNWAAEAARFVPGLRVTTVGATQAASRAAHRRRRRATPTSSSRATPSCGSTPTPSPRSTGRDSCSTRPSS